MRGTTLLAASLPVLGLWLGCNAILGTGTPILEGSGGGTGASSSSSSASSSSSSGSGGTGGGPACVSEGSWAHWNPDEPKAYVTSMNKLVLDPVTHLIWQNQVEQPEQSISYQGASDYCDTLTWGGLSGWRLPTRIELASILDLTGMGNQMIDPVAFPDTPEAWFWTSTPFVAAPGDRWAIWFVDGSMDKGAPTDMNAVRCVHDPDPADAGPAACHRYQLIGDAAVQDVETTLIWQRTVDSTQVDVASAGCDKLDLAGLATGWRLPTIQELTTLVDDAHAGPALDATVFPSAPIGPYWSGTPNVTPGENWYIPFDTGVVTAMDAGNPAYVRCVHP